MFRVGQGGQRAVPTAARQEAHRDATPDHAWKVVGLFYFNPHDPAIWVENRVGLGYTLNIGNSRAWLLIGMMGGAGNCRPFPVLRLRLKRGAFEHHSIQPMRTWITSDAGCSTACGI